MIEGKTVVRGCCVITVVLAATNASGASASLPLTCGPKTTVVKELTDRGIDHAKNGRFAEAEPCFLLARELKSGAQQWTNLGSLYLDWTKKLTALAKSDEAKRRLEQSAAAFEGAFKAPDGPPPALTHHLLAGVYFNIGKKAQAIPQLEKLLLRSDAQPADRERAHHMLDTFVREPLVKLSEKEWEEHDALFKEGNGLVSPHFVLAGEVRKSVSAAVKADLKKGIDRFKRVVAMEPRNWSAYWMMGKAHEALGDEPAAYEAFKRSGAIHPYHPDVADVKAGKRPRPKKLPLPVLD